MKEEAEDEWGWNMSSGVHMPGRIVLNVWRLMKSGEAAGALMSWRDVSRGVDREIHHESQGCLRVLRGFCSAPCTQPMPSCLCAGPLLLPAEVKLRIYTLENCAAAVLQLRVPHVRQRQLAAWFSTGPAGAALAPSGDAHVTAAAAAG